MSRWLNSQRRRMSLGLILALLISVFPFSPASSQLFQEPEQAWAKRYNGTADDWDSATDMVIDSSGNVYVTGKSQGRVLDRNDLNDYVTIKYDPAGNQAWGTGEAGVRRYNGIGNKDDEAKAMAIDPTGGFIYVTGKSFNSTTGNSDYVTIKYDAATGNQAWGTGEAGVRRFDGPDGPGDPVGDEAVAIAVDSGGNVYVTGKSYGGRETNDDYATIKYDTNGNKVWGPDPNTGEVGVRRYNGPVSGRDAATDIAIDPTSGFVYVTGESQGTGLDFDYATIKYDPATGNRVWGPDPNTGEAGVRRYDGPGSLAMNDDIPHSLAIAPTGGFIYVTGESGGLGLERDYATIKYDTNGNKVWGPDPNTGEVGVRRYDGPGNKADIPVSSAVDSGGNIYVTGYSQGTGLDFDYLTIKYDAAGNEVWAPEAGRYGGTVGAHDFASDLALDPSGNVYVTGRSPGNQFNNDYATIKYATTGARLWIKRYNGSVNGTDNASAVAVDSQDPPTVYVTGESEGGTITGTNTPNYDYATVKYVPDTTPPTNPTISSPSHTLLQWSRDNTVQVSWTGATDNFSGVDGYSYEWTVSSNTLPDDIKEVGANVTSVISPPLADGSSWFFHIRTVDRAGNWNPSASHFGPFYIDATPPTTPTGLSAFAVSTNQINLLWSASTDVSSGLAEYKIERSSDGVNFTQIATTTGTSQANMGLSAVTPYWYQVRARDNAGNHSTYSNIASATTLPPPVFGTANALFGWGDAGLGDIPVVGDFNNDGEDDVGIFRPTAAQWYFNTSFSSLTTSFIHWGLPGDDPIVGDFINNDGIDDIGIFRSSTGRWYLNRGPNFDSVTDYDFQWGMPRDTPFVGDFDGDGQTDVGLRRSSTAQWFLNQGVLDSNGEANFIWGNAGLGDIPVVGDFNSDGRDEVAISRPSAAQWYFKWDFSNNNTNNFINWGLVGDHALSGDFDGDTRRDDIGIFRPSTGKWYFNWGHSHDSITDYNFQWGTPGDTPLTGDFNGDTQTDVGLRRSSTAEWFFDWSSLP